MSTKCKRKIDIEKKASQHWSALVIIENNQEVKTVAPHPWVDLKNMILYWPPKHKLLSFYIARWSTPESSWTNLRIVKVLLESGLKSVAQDMISFLSTTENDTEVDSEESDSDIEEKSDKCVTSPVIKCKRSMTQIPEEDTSISTIENLFHTPTSSSKGISSKNVSEICSSPTRVSFSIHPVTSTKNTCGKYKSYTDGGTSFKEMSTKQFQYTVLMRLAKLEENQKNISETLGLLRDNDMKANNDSGCLEVLRSIEEFETEEIKLKDNAYLQKKKNQIKEVGGKDARTALDAIMSREIQDSFSLYGLKNKQSFSKTLHYLCLTGALLNSSKEDYRKDKLDYHIGDILKRAIRNKVMRSPRPAVS